MQLTVPAKINLFLHVVNRRGDGYHNLYTLMCKIGICDVLDICFDIKKGVRIACDHPDVPEDHTNIAAKAAECFLSRLDEKRAVRHPGVAITLKKNIPVAAGLGGGSSNAAGVLRGMNHYFNQPFSQRELMAMGAGLGADVPFFLFDRTALAKGIGEKLIPYSRLKPYSILLVSPGFSVSTAWVYKNLKLGLTKPEKQLRYQSFEGRSFTAGEHLHNDLEKVTISKYPEIQRIKQTLIASGADGALMSGSGPTVFGLFSDPEKARQARDGFPVDDRMRVFMTELIIE